MLRAVVIVLTGALTGLFFSPCLFFFPTLTYPIDLVSSALGIVNEDTRAFLAIWIIFVVIYGSLLNTCVWILLQGYRKFRATHI